MQFAYSLPWWLAAIFFVVLAAAVVAAYRRPLSPLTTGQRALLVSLRGASLALLAVCLLRPVVLRPPAAGGHAIVPVLIDTSRSMRLTDADGMSRLARARAIFEQTLQPSLSPRFTVRPFGVGDRIDDIDPAKIAPTARRSDLVEGLQAVRTKYRGQSVAGIVLISDGGDTSQASEGLVVDDGPPVFTVGVGSAAAVRDREVRALAAGEQPVDQATVDLHLTAVSNGFGRAPFFVRILANGQPVDTRRVVPQADGSPIEEVFTVSPNPLTPTVYTAEIPADEGETVRENNTRSVLVNPIGRKRRLLVIEGAPGFDHTFMRRAWAQDPGLEVDSVVRKGKNAEGQDTFFVQASAGQTASLARGFPVTREDLFVYDAIVLANADGDLLTRAQLSLAAAFVAERGGGLLVIGGRSFADHGLGGTPLEEALPVELNDRRGGLASTALGAAPAPPHNKLVVTPDGENHPITRIGDSADAARRRWAAMPLMASSAPLGGPKPGASILAVTGSPSGAVYPVVAVQRYGRGRSMIFAGEASWRWKMMVSSSDRSYEMFWRQAGRWLATSAPDPVSITVPDATEAGDTPAIEIDVRDAAFLPAADAQVDATLTLPGGDTHPLTVRRIDGPGGSRFTASVRTDQAALYRVHADARREGMLLGAADRWLNVGGSDREFADPRLNEGFLRRLARRSGGQYVPANEAGQLVDALASIEPEGAPPEPRDVWNEPWVVILLVALVSTEWTLRRRWGLR